MSLHQQRVHPSPVEGCYGCRVGSVRWGGLHRLRAENDGGYTQAGIAKEIYEGARTSGKDITQVRGRRRAHEVVKDGAWEKV